MDEKEDTTIYKVVKTDKHSIPQSSHSGPYPLFFAQQRLWFLEQLEPGSSTYNIPRAFRISGALNGDVLYRALTAIVDRHKSLRTTFTATEKEPVQVIAQRGQLPLPVVDLRQVPTAAREAEAQRLITEEARRPFDLAQGPLIRVVLLRLGEEEHILMLTVHHIVSDGWSMSVFFRELAALYEAFSQGQPSPLAELPIQYADYVVWQREWLQGEVLERQLAYWKQQLANAPAALELPTDRPRPAVQTFRGSTQPVALSKPLSEGLKALCRREGVTLFMTLLAAFKVLLYRYTGQSDIVVGSPIAGRTRIQTEELIGYFANTLVLRTDLSGDPTFRILLERIREVALGAYTHQELPFEKLVEVLHPERDLSYNPLFQVLFALHNTPPTLLELPGLIVDPMEVDSGTVRFDLALDLREQPQGLNGSLEYNTDLFDTATITQMLGHFQTLLECIAADPDRRLSTLSLLSEAERQQVLVEWNGQPIHQAHDSCLHELFESHVERAPDAVAVVCAGKQLTYRELNCRANQLAHHLRKLGVQAEVPVGICVERSVEMVVGLLAILKAGGAYVPLDPDYPAERIAYMLEDIQAPVLLTQRRPGKGLIEDTGSKIEDGDSRFSILDPRTQVVYLDADWAVIAEQSEENPSVGITPENLAYVIYTSGSTGKPKGVQICHRSVARLLEATRQVFRFDEHDVWTVFHSYAFDFSVWEIWGALLQGARLIVVPRHVAQSAAAFYDLLRAERVTVLNQTPSAMRQLIEARPEASDSDDPWNPRLVICGGEAFPRDLVSPLMGWGASIWNFYGPTEATVWAAINPITSSGPERESISIGRPIADRQIYLLDTNLQPVPIGVSGELHIGGAGLARGYFKRPELTAEKFIPDPFSNEPGARLYKTGDSARYLPDGTIDFLGRIDNQVKIRGFRIELGEIEAVLAQHPSVREAVVVMRDDAFGAKRLVAYVVPDRQQTYTVNDLRSFLGEKLPDYMLPSAFVALRTLPLTPNGKVDRRALPTPDQTRPELEEAFIAPRNSAEKALAEIWTEVLQLERVGIHDNFFELGGHSLLATRVVSRLRTALGVEISLRSLFQRPTVAGLAEHVETVRRAGQGLQTPPLRPIPRDREIPLSFAQERLWFVHQLEPDSPAYNIPKAVRMSGALNIRALQKSLGAIVGRHETLRTTFTAVDGIPRQVISKNRSIELGMIDLSDWPRPERETELQRLLREKALLPFNLCSDLMLRATLMRLGEDEHVLLLVMHHIASDGWSIANFCREAAVLYEAFSSGRSSPLPDLTIQYADFAVWERERMQGKALEKELSYWRGQLRGAPAVLKLPTHRQRATAKTLRGTHESFVLSGNVTQALKALSLDSGATLFMTLLAAFQILLYRYTKQHDIVVGTPIAGRNQSEVEDLIGFFVNGLLLRTDLSGNPSFRKLLKRVREVTLAAFIHQEMPITKVVEALRPESRLGHGSLFQVTFALQNNPMQPLELTGLTVSPIEVDTETTKIDLALVMWETPEELNGRFEYNTDLFDAGTIIRMIARFQRLLEAIVADPEQPLSQLVLSTEATRDVPQTDFSTPSVPFQSKRPDPGGGIFEESYRLSPMQEGMIFHSLYATESGVDIEQTIFKLHEKLDVPAFDRAWQRVVERHSALRTSFYLDAHGELFQRVRKHVHLGLKEQDWRGLSIEEREERLKIYLKTDRKQGFDLLEAPLMRLALFRLAEADYQFGWTFHHALLDGRAFSLVLKEVFDYYEAFREGRDLQLEQPCPYRKYIDWLQGLDLSRAETFWREALHGFAAPTPLPVQASHGMPVAEKGHGKQATRLSADLTSGLQSLAQQHQLTLNTLVQAAWGILLSRYSGEQDIVFGATRACRSSTVDKAESIVGVFINTLPVRIKVSPEVSLLPWLKELRAQQIAVREYEHTPLVKIQGWSDLPRGTPLFKSILVFENYQHNAALRAQGGGWKNREFRLLEQTNYSLTLSGYAEPELLFEIAYDRGRFDDETIARMLDHLRILLEGMAANPERRLSDLSLLSDDERRQLLVEWNDTGRNYPTNKCIHQLVEAQVEQTPDSTAVVFHDRRMTYRELNHKANEIAVSLAERGIGKGFYVPFLMDRSIEVLISMLAIMKTGAAFVPLDINWPSERTKQILDDLDSGIILVNKTTPHDEEALGRFFLLVDEKESSAVPAVNLNIPSDPANPIYAIYTSGSTGKPKAAVVPHRGITNRFLWMNEFFGCATAAAALQTTHHVYDSAVWQLFWPLINGGKSIIPSPGMETNADYLAALIERHEVTITDFVPSVFNTIVPPLVDDGSVRKKLRSLRTIIVGGEEITPSTTYSFIAHFPGVRVINLYGPTEASIGCICYEVTGKEDGKIPIGRPISNVHVVILGR